MNFIKNKIVCIFGGTGSFGKAFLKKAIVGVSMKYQ
jgi:FlaA1/EpsC-like NDP-sugar epimerase